MQGSHQFYSLQVYHKILKISPSMYKPPGPVTQKNLQIQDPRGLVLGKLPSNYKVKQSKNGKFTSNYKASPIDLETQISLCR